MLHNLIFLKLKLQCNIYFLGLKGKTPEPQAAVKKAMPFVGKMPRKRENPNRDSNSPAAKSKFGPLSSNNVPPPGVANPTPPPPEDKPQPPPPTSTFSSGPTYQQPPVPASFSLSGKRGPKNPTPKNVDLKVFFSTSLF